MKKEKKTRKNKSKLALLSLAATVPMLTTGIVGTNLSAFAETSSSSYSRSYVEEVTLSNNNFNSSTSSSPLNTYPSGWTSQLKNTKTTSGIINTGNTFQNYMSGTLYLSKNPHASSADNRVLMINSRTSENGNYSVSRQGYQSNSVTLAENSFYTFQVAFKADTNYETKTEYVIAGTIGLKDEQTEVGPESEPYEISKETFTANPVKSFKLNEDGTVDKEYFSFRYEDGHTYYLVKTLTKLEEKITSAESGDLNDVEYFYEDDFFYGFLYGAEKKPVYVRKTQAHPVDAAADESETAKKINIDEGADAYECPDITFTPDESSATSGVYKVKAGTHYYKSKTVANELNSDTRGSIYLNGLVDKDGNDVKAEYVSITSKEWVNFYFFVATGNKSQNVNLELWLGTDAGNKTSTGVVFFDDVHIHRYSENAFWKTYKDYYGKGYDLVWDKTPNEHQDCTTLVDLREKKESLISDIDFEEGTFNESSSSLLDWEKTGSGTAQIVNVSYPNKYNIKVNNEYKTYDFVGSDLSCDVTFEENGVKVTKIEENDYALGLFADNSTLKVTNKNAIKIESKKIYKISAKYKISTMADGNVYLFVEENLDGNDTLKSLADKELYTAAAETSTSGINSNASNNFTNNYGTLEFYVKGGSLYDSAVNISLGLGKTDENATGGVLFDNIKVESATSEEFSSASNKLELGSSSTTSSSTISNGEFDLVTVGEKDDGLYAPQNWTITKGDGILYSGVINTDPATFAAYRNKFDENQKNAETKDINNPYYWASFTNPGNRFGDSRPDNVFVFGNMTNSWQKLKSETFTIGQDTNYALSFWLKTSGTLSSAGVKISVFTDSGKKLFESNSLSAALWEKQTIYFKSFYGETKVYFEIDFVTEEIDAQSVAYFDGFALESENVTIPSNAKYVVDMDEFGMKLPTTKISSNVHESETSEIFTSSSTSGEDYSVGGIVKGEFDEQKSPYYFNNEEDGKSADHNFFYLEVNRKGSHTLTSNFNIDLKASTYYVLSFKVKTHFNYLDDFTLDKDKKYDYGVVFGLTGYKYLTNVVSNEKFEEYRIFINSTDAKTAQLYMALICDAEETGGSAAIYDVSLTTTTEDEYEEAKNSANADESKVFVADTDASSNDESENPDEETEENTNNGQDFNWLLIPTLITALAIVIAVVGYFLRKVKIKKIQIKRRNSYDRKTSANVDFIKRKAAEERDNELKGLQTTKAKFEQELARLETEHKSKIVGLREKDKGAVSKETDKEFKIFAKKRTVIAEKLDVLNKQIEETNSPEHLLSLERKIYAEQESARRDLEKASKKAEKEKAKQSTENK